MATPAFYQTLYGAGVDPTTYYAVSASTTPETPSAPFAVGTQAFGSDGSAYVFVQASSSISLTDFVLINSGAASLQYQASSLTTTNVTNSLAVGIGSTGLVLRQSVTFIPSGAFFWACTKGQNIPATTSGGATIVQGAGTGLATNTSGVLLFTSSVPGVLTSVTTSASLQAAFLGIICVNSLTVSIAASIVPPAGDTKSNGFTVGPVVNMNSPRPYSNYTVSGTIIAAGGIPTQIFSF